MVVKSREVRQQPQGPERKPVQRHSCGPVKSSGDGTGKGTGVHSCGLLSDSANLKVGGPSSLSTAEEAGQEGGRGSSKGT